MGILPYFPLAGGFLTGKYKRGEEAPAGSRGESSEYVQRYMTEAHYDQVEALSAWAEARDHSMVELAHAWAAGAPGRQQRHLRRTPSWRTCRATPKASSGRSRRRSWRR